MTSPAKKLTPMMQQYLEVKSKLPPNTLLLFRLGDFYEMFDDDARVGADVLGITLTQRNGQPMAGIPYHAADGYIQKTLKAGMKVAICEQMETPKPGQLVKRSLSRILTPGTTLEDQHLDAGRNQYLLACNWTKRGLSAAWLDLTTGDFQIAASPAINGLINVFHALDPREIILPEEALEKWRAEDDTAEWSEEIERLLQGRTDSTMMPWQFDPRDGARLVMETLGVMNLDGFGIALDHPGLGPAGALLAYAAENLCSKPENIRRIREYRSSDTLQMDPSTLRNLEIFRASQGTRKGSLIEAMDATTTAPGARLLEQVLMEPPLDIAELKRRQSCVGEFLSAPGLASELQEYLRGVRDLPRIVGRLRNGLRNPREPGAIRQTLHQLPHIKAVIEQFDSPELTKLAADLNLFPELLELLDSALNDSLPNQIQDGGFIADGFDAELDRLRDLNRNSRQWIADFEAAEIKRTGIKSLKVKFNNAFGYFIEVRKSNLELVPDDYIRKQTVTNAERFYTPDLKEKEREILHADEKAIAREESLFADILAAVLENADSLEQTAHCLSEIDLFVGWAQIAREWNYSRPEIDESSATEIEGGRHPVVEQMMREQRQKGIPGEHDFVPNDTFLSADEAQISIITGPNMAGKSTYIRQVALITLMAQVGSWVPAAQCRIGLVDRIFSRVGASDELSQGNSTFMVEMNETANILNNATDRSLIILDEIGRGTSTYDGLSIAWAVVEHLHGHGAQGPRTLFATHYHELTQIEGELVRTRNYCVAVKEWNDQIIFVRQVQRGAADRSYGIQVARLAGLPDTVINRAKVILSRLEDDDSSHNILRKRMRARKDGTPEKDIPQLELF
ncbi:DNA mismatch repair protein MutS [Puniceicoccales bacterium CK1056]|uniref:DNA mismatch repair protein MutS n=1 Tax=Oceanipulchritudo coccoides TaxID=2706888 RepID=A0A6B2LYG8_9BACT|nr:DNA mismatch repair protein MutS [Oceanipulchritudo coccoides]NDV61192.1 DNA mismatch repair protein MutS [Oceanipulchritudo coccoides]